MGPPPRPSGAVAVGRGGARERAKVSPKVETEQSGLWDDEAGLVIVFGTLASVIYGVILMLL